MKINQFSRLQTGLGPDRMKTLKNSTVLVVGIGGVGSFAVEAIARSGVGNIILVDYDTVDITNVNRQIHALLSTVGKSKTELMKERISDINKECNVKIYDSFFNEETYDEILSNKIDFVIDSSDTITFKILLIKECLKRDIKFISSMGTANKMDPTKFEIMDIKKTSYDPIAKIIRLKLKKERIKGKVPVVCSIEQPFKPEFNDIGDESSEIRKKKIPPSSNSFVPSTAGLICASYAIRKLTGVI